jgi:putative redox protein
MATKTATVTLDGDGMRFLGSVGSGHPIVLDDGNGDTGARPSELIPLGLAGCTAMDVISILRKKRQDVRRYSVEASGTQMEGHPNAFTRIDIIHVVEGSGIDPAAVARAIELSATRYCAVGSTLASGMVEIHNSYRVIDTETGAELVAQQPATAAPIQLNSDAYPLIAGCPPRCA